MAGSYDGEFDGARWSSLYNQAVEPIGESCLLWRVGRGVSAANSARVHRLYRRIKNAQDEGAIDVRDVVPGYDSLAIHFDPLSMDLPRLERLVDGWLDHDDEADPVDHGAAEPTALVVRYDGPDLSRVAACAGRSVAEVVSLHTRPTYTVAAIGFMPHFPYLLGLDPALTTPRLESPRVRVPAGSVAIGGDQTGVYPRDSPGGWNLIGHADPHLLTSLPPGDRVRFVAAEGLA